MELAINQYGEAFAPPSEAVAWQVRRMNDTKHGGPLPTFGADGRPLTLPLAASMADFQATLRKHGAAPGKYRLDPLDRTGQPIKGGTCSYLLYPSGDDVRNGNTGGLRNAPAPVQGWAPVGAVSPSPWSSSPGPVPAMWSTGGAFPLPTPVALSGQEYLLGEAFRAQVAITESIARAHVQMQAINAQAQAQAQAHVGELLTAAAELVRAADGASLTKRKPGAAMTAPAPQVIVQPVAQPIYEAPPSDEREEPEATAPVAQPASAMSSWMNDVMAMIGPMIAPIVTAKLGELLGGGGFAAPIPEAMPRNAAPVIDVEPEAAAPEPEPEPAPAPVDIMPAAWSHLAAVARYLGPDGKCRLDAVLRTLSRDEQIKLARDLVALPLASAAERVIAWVSVRELRAARAQASAPTAPVAPAGPVGAAATMPEHGAAVLASMRASVASAMAAGAATEPAGEALSADAEGVDAAAGEASDGAPSGAELDGTVPEPGAAVLGLYGDLASEDNAVGSFLRAHPAGAVLVHAATRLMEPEALRELDDAINGASLPGEVAAAIRGPLDPAAPAPTAPLPAAAPVKVSMPAAMARMAEVLPHLSPDERATAQALALKMPTAQRDAMMATLVAVPVPEAVQIVREVVAEYVKHGRPFDR